MNSYYPFIISGCVTLLAVYLSSNDSNTPVWFASMGFCLIAYALYLNISAIIRAFYKFVTPLFRKTNK